MRDPFISALCCFVIAIGAAGFCGFVKDGAGADSFLAAALVIYVLMINNIDR